MAMHNMDLPRLLIARGRRFIRYSSQLEEAQEFDKQPVAMYAWPCIWIFLRVLNARGRRFIRQPLAREKAQACDKQPVEMYAWPCIPGSSSSISPGHLTVGHELFISTKWDKRLIYILLRRMHGHA